MAHKVKVNTPIPLTLQLWDGATDKYPQAEIRDSGGSLALGSPIDLPHVGSGLYRDLTKSLASAQIISVTFVTYDDAGHTIESPIHQRSTIDFEILPEVIGPDTPVFTEGQKEITGIIPGYTRVIGLLQNRTILGKVSSSILIGKIGPEGIQGQIQADAKVIGQMRCDQ